MSKKSIAFFFCFITSILLGQELMTLQSKSYPATPTWNFMCDNYVMSGIATIQIAKSEKGGYLKIAVETNNPAFAITGNVYVDLKDFTAIICTDKGLRTTEGNQIISYYTFSPAEMNRLQKVDIESVRFLINGKSTSFSSQTGYFTAFNKKKFFHTAYDSNITYYETATAVRDLLQKK
jgi:hypothetical protein